MRSFTFNSLTQVQGAFAQASIKDLNFIEDTYINGMTQDDYTVFQLIHTLTGGSLRSSEQDPDNIMFSDYFQAVSGETDLIVTPTYIREYSNFAMFDTTVTPANAFGRASTRLFLSQFNSTYLNTVATTLVSQEFDLGIGVAQAIGSVSDSPESIENLISTGMLPTIRTWLSKHKKFIIASTTISLYLNCFYEWTYFDAGVPNTPTPVGSFAYTHYTFAELGGLVPCTPDAISNIQAITAGKDNAISYVEPSIQMPELKADGMEQLIGHRSISLIPRHMFGPLQKSYAIAVQPLDIAASFGVYKMNPGTFSMNETLAIRTPDWLSAFMYDTVNHAFWILQIATGAALIQHRMTPKLLNYTRYNALPKGDGAIAQTHRFVGNYLEHNMYTHMLSEQTQGYNGSYSVDKRYVWIPGQALQIRSFLMALPTNPIPGYATNAAILAKYDMDTAIVISPDSDVPARITAANASGDYSRIFREVGDPARNAERRAKAYTDKHGKLIVEAITIEEIRASRLAEYAKIKEIDESRRNNPGEYNLSDEAFTEKIKTAGAKAVETVKAFQENDISKGLSKSISASIKEATPEYEAELKEKFRKEFLSEAKAADEKTEMKVEAEVKPEMKVEAEVKPKVKTETK